MKVDLHCHTKKVLDSDGDGRNVTASMFSEKISNAEIGIAAITNHNHFDKSQYLEFRDAVKSFCQVWPGIELTMGSESEIWHLIVVCNPNQVEEFASALHGNLIQVSPKQCLFSIAEVVASLDCLDVVYIPHDHGKRSGNKSRAIPSEKRQELQELVRNPSRIISEPNHHSLGVLSKHGYRVILGSDIKEWSKYESSKVADFRFPISSFESFAKLVEGDVGLYNDIALNNGVETALNVKPVPESDPIAISLYRGVNIIFGQKGTGKSKLIEAINEELNNAGLSADLYKAGEIRDRYKNDLSTVGLISDSSSVGRPNYASVFERIINWKDRAITSPRSYIDYKNGVVASKNRLRLVIADVGRNEIFTRQKDLNEVIDDLRHIEKGVDEISQSNPSRYLDNEDLEKMNSTHAKLLKGSDSRKTDLVIEKYSIRLLNHTITSIKRHAESLCEASSAPSGTGFLEYAENRLSLKRDVDTILATLDGFSKDEREPYGYIDDKGQIDLITRRLVFSGSKSPADYFGGKKTGLDKVKKSLRRVSDNALNPELATKHDELLKDIRDAEITSYDDFVGIKRFTAFEGTDFEYEPSDGELAIVLMKRFLSSDLDFYLLDEPERGMGNSYIDKNIRRDEIAKLAEQGKTVVLVTHNANLAIRTMPVFSFLLEYHGKNEFAIYAGSPYSNALVNLINSNDKKTWSEESMEILEGGEEAFYDRKDMYELC